MHPLNEYFLHVRLQEQNGSSYPRIYSRQPGTFIITRSRHQNARIIAKTAVFMCLVAVLAVLVSCYRSVRKAVRPAAIWRRLAGGDKQTEDDILQSIIVDLCIDLQEDYPILGGQQTLRDEHNENAPIQPSSSEFFQQTSIFQGISTPSNTLAHQESQVSQDLTSPELLWEQSATAHQAHLQMHMAWLKQLPLSASPSEDSQSLEKQPSHVTSSYSSESSMQTHYQQGYAQNAFHMPTTSPYSTFHVSGGPWQQPSEGYYEEDLIGEEKLASYEVKNGPEDQQQWNQDQVVLVQQKWDQNEVVLVQEEPQVKYDDETDIPCSSIALASQESMTKSETQVYSQQSMATPQSMYSNLLLSSSASSSSLPFESQPMLPQYNIPDPYTTSRQWDSGIQAPYEASFAPYSSNIMSSYLFPSSNVDYRASEDPMMGSSTSGEYQHYQHEASHMVNTNLNDEKQSISELKTTRRGNIKGESTKIRRGKSQSAKSSRKRKAEPQTSEMALLMHSQKAYQMLPGDGGVPQDASMISSMASPKKKRRRVKKTGDPFVLGFEPCKLLDYKLPEPLSPHPNHENSFYSLPVWRGQVEKEFDYQTLLKGKGSYSEMKALRILRSLLAQRELSDADAEQVIELVQKISSFLLSRHLRDYGHYTARGVLAILGRRYMYLEAVFTAIQVIGSAMHADKWWIPLLKGIPTYYNPTVVVKSEAQKQDLMLAVRLSQALEMLKSGSRPDPDTTILLKRDLVCSKRFLKGFTSELWNPWKCSQNM